MDIKLFFVLASMVVGTAGYIPYLKDIFARRTQPHVYTWLVWAITQGTATAILFYGGGGWATLGLAMAVAYNLVIISLCIKYGTKNITLADTVALITALIAIVVWWQLKQPLLAAIMVTVIDFLGYLPTFRKTFVEPWSETVKSWLLFFLAMVFAVLALKEYNLLTLIYLSMVILCNLTVALISILRRPYVYNH